MQQITRDNHYVPQWYQRGFMANGKHKLHVLNLQPEAKSLPTGQIVLEPEVEEHGPKQAFVERDLYTIRWGRLLNDDIETFLFGKIDKSGADAVRGWISGNAIQIHRKFMDFFEYMDAQKLRTPKGLDWILKNFNGLPHVELMRQMQAVRQMHCTMWSECVREIVSAADSPVKFLVSDHPVTVYHPKLPPGTPECGYPLDPGIELVGSQTLFALDKNHCLILTNLEYAEDPQGAAHLSRRTNARFRGDSMARTDTFIRGRQLSEMEVHAVNRILKSRAKRYLGAGNPTWLYPERHCDVPWKDLGSILLPQRDLWRFGGETYIGYKDGTTGYRDQFGRTSTSHKFLAKSAIKEDPPQDARCGCGSGLLFRDCCSDVAPTMRPSWRVMGIRERNIALLNGIHDIFLSNEKKSWFDVRRDLSDDQVRRIHELFAALWPTDTRLIDLLPSPKIKRSRALFLGMTDASTVSALVVGMLAYVDEVVVVHPFVNANGVRPEFSPIKHPAQHRDQTLRNVFTMLILEPFIAAGRVHLIPDPLDYDVGFRQEIMSITKRFEGKGALGPIDKAFAKALSKDELMRYIKRLPLEDLKAQILKTIPEGKTDLTKSDLDSVANFWKRELEDDPLALLEPLASGGPSGEFRVMKGFSRETGLFISTLVGAFVYTNSDTMWARLHDTDGVHTYEPNPASTRAIVSLNSWHIHVPTQLVAHPVDSAYADSIREQLRKISLALFRGEISVTEVPEIGDTNSSQNDDDRQTFRLRASVPVSGFQRTDVSRLVLTFGRMQNVAPVRLALFLDPEQQNVQTSPELDLQE